MNKKLFWIIKTLFVLLCILITIYIVRTPHNLSLHGTFQKNQHAIQMVFNEDKHTYYIDFFSQQEMPDDHGTFKKIYDDLYLLENGVLDGKLVRLFPDYMEIKAPQDASFSWEFKKITNIPTM